METHIHNGNIFFLGLNGSPNKPLLQVLQCMFYATYTEIYDTSTHSEFSHTMSAITAIVRTNMAAIAQVFLAHRVRSIHTEKDTNLLENICNQQNVQDVLP